VKSWVAELLEPAKHDVRQAAGLARSGVLELAFEAAAGRPGSSRAGGSAGGGGSGSGAGSGGSSSPEVRSRQSSDQVRVFTACRSLDGL